MSGTSLPTLDEPRAGRLTIHYAPEAHAVIAENPPRFTWLPVIEDEARYLLRITPADGAPQTFGPIRWNMFTPDAALPPGDYTWAFAACDEAGKQATTWSQERAFFLAEGLPETPLPARKDRFAKADMAHPRLWLGPDRLAAFKAAVAADPSHCGWDVFLKKSVLPWMDRPVMTEPAGYPNHQRTPPVWRQTYIDLQEAWYAIRHLAIGGAVLDDAAMTNRAKEWLLELASWDPMGMTSRAYTDEWAYRVNNALAWGYDWLHGALSEDERATVRGALLARTRDIAEHAMINAKIHLFPYDSHAVRSVSLTIIPACIALLGDDADDEAREWLDYCVEFLFTVYSPWGDSDGGWAEGTNYWMMGIAYLIDAANRLKSFSGIDLYKRPFFQNTGDFPLFCKAPDTRRATFGDDSTQGELPGIKTGLNMRQFAGVTGNGAYQWYCEENLRLNPGTEGAFYNWGWWDTNFDEMAFRTDYPEVEATPPEGGMRHFRGIGWVGVQHAMADPDEHIQFVFKSSPFGSVSHSHGDQNAFCLSAYGEDLAIQSGYYVAFGSTMHRNWRRQTRSKNAILINGKGQYAEKDKARAMAATGRILAAEQHEDHVFIHGDATAAYQSLSPEVTRAEREVYFVRNSYFVIVDKVDASEPVTVDWLLHANNRYDLGQTSFRNTGQRAGFYGQVVWSEAGKPEITQTTDFPDVDPKDYEGLPVSTFLTARYPAATRHRIATLLVPYRLEAPKRIFHFVDDQGYDADLYFTDADENAFRVVLKKLANT
ncbi:heparinase II/III family protein [Citreicella sp. C3M06]|uniref:heparinase II/III domain-containing protein n=1 Tax=Citreicella sp. C3M06 TaxID=2841564 RepID=UPI001C09F85C|nr:heparinase II/III family protein [Citreicella sp. C3M06]MBU2962793.1 heparinase II/III family protein [Citreicella sp. C3M06]